MSSWSRELGRMAAIIAVSSLIGLTANALSPRPVPLLASDGPGAWPDRAPRIGAAELAAAWAGKRALLLLDVRSLSAFQAGHASAAVHAPAVDFLQH